MKIVSLLMIHYRHLYNYYYYYYYRYATAVLEGLGLPLSERNLNLTSFFSFPIKIIFMTVWLCNYILINH